MGQGPASQRADRPLSDGESAAEVCLPEVSDHDASGQSDRTIWIALYAVELAGGEELVTDAHEAAAEQAWTDAMAEIRAMDSQGENRSEPWRA